jgi:hypothetical protein
VPLEAIDKSVTGHCPAKELIRYMHIALLCVQEEPSKRPEIANVILMLRSHSMTLPAPTAPNALMVSDQEYDHNFWKSSSTYGGETSNECLKLGRNPEMR